MRFIAPSTATKSPQRRLQEGQAIVLIALLMLVLFAMLGLAIDSGRAYVDRRDLQAAVDAGALAAGDWYENYSDLFSTNYGIFPHSKKLFETDLRLYSGPYPDSLPPPNFVGPLGNLRQDTDTINYPGGITLTITATNTQFNGYQFVFYVEHQLPLAFMQIFGGPTTALITATATSIVGNQRQTPALLTLSTANCATSLQGGGRLTVLGDTYSNGTVCTGLNLHEAGNCYGAAGSQCNQATYYCYNANPGFIPFDQKGPPPPPHPPGACAGADVLGGPIVPAPSLPDPGYLAPSVPFYSGSGVMIDHGSYTELTPGAYNGFFLSGPGCYFLDAGVYTWNGNYVSHGGMVSNELKPPDEALWNGPTGSQAQTGDNTQSGNVCFFTACMRESAPSACHEASTIDLSNQGINVNITVNSPGAQYYNVYVNPQGCVGDVGYIGGTRSDFSFVNTFAAPAAGATLTGGLAPGGWACPAAGVTVCSISYNNVLPATTRACSTWLRANKHCWTPEDETPPTCFSNCPPVAAVPQENAPWGLQYYDNTGGDVANENYCQAARS